MWTVSGQGRRERKYEVNVKKKKIVNSFKNYTRSDSRFAFLTLKKKSSKVLFSKHKASNAMKAQALCAKGVFVESMDQIVEEAECAYNSWRARRLGSRHTRKEAWGGRRKL